jgi:hypothetical protein
MVGIQIDTTILLVLETLLNGSFQPTAFPLFRHRPFCGTKRNASGYASLIEIDAYASYHQLYFVLLV